MTTLLVPGNTFICVHTETCSKMWLLMLSAGSGKRYFLSHLNEHRPRYTTRPLPALRAVRGVTDGSHHCEKDCIWPVSIGPHPSFSIATEFIARISPNNREGQLRSNYTGERKHFFNFRHMIYFCLNISNTCSLPILRPHRLAKCSLGFLLSPILFHISRFLSWLCNQGFCYPCHRNCPCQLTQGTYH